MVEGFTDPILINKMMSKVQELINNTNYAFGQRGVSSSNETFFKRKNLYDECDFPRTSDIDPDRMRELYNRDALAARVIEIWPKECWQVSPEIYEDNRSDVTTAFESAWELLGTSLVSEPGYFNKSKGNKVNDYLQRADIMSGIGRYGVILLGLNDGLDLAEPARSLPELTKLVSNNIDPSNPNQVNEAVSGLQRLNYIRVFDESQARIVARETNVNSKRYGQPTAYQIVFDNPNNLSALLMTPTTYTSSVHWTRVVHIVDNDDGSGLIGDYRCRTVLNDILSAQKCRWGSGEGYWRSATPKLSFETNPQLGGDVVINKSKMQSQMENVMNGLQQWWIITGMQAKQIAPSMIDPSPFVMAAVQAICIRWGIPIPIFTGYEIGSLASAMNTEQWNGRVKGRQVNQVTPRVICPFIDRLINLGILPIPPLGYYVEWPDITSHTQKENAQVQALRINICVAYIKNGLDKLIPPVEFFVRFLGLDETDAMTLYQTALEEIQKQNLVQTINPPSTTQTQQPSNLNTQTDTTTNPSNNNPYSNAPNDGVNGSNGVMNNRPIKV